MSYTLKPKHKKSIVQTDTWRKDGKYVFVETVYRWGGMSFEADQDQLDELIYDGTLDNENGINPLTIDVEETDYVEVEDESYVGYEFENMDQAESVELEERFEDEPADMVLEELGWEVEDSEFEFQGTLVVEDADGNIIGEGE